MNEINGEGEIETEKKQKRRKSSEQNAFLNSLLKQLMPGINMEEQRKPCLCLKTLKISNMLC